MVHRFYTAAGQITDDHITFTDEQRRQMRNVLRMHVGDTVAAFDGSGREFTIEIEALDAKTAAGRIRQVETPDTEPRVRLTLVQGLPKGERIDLVLQKCTEIGVAEFLIVRTAWSVPRIPPEKVAPRLDRWRAIAREAAEQSGRTRVPSVDGVIPFKEALARAKGGVGLIAWEEESELLLSSELSRLLDAGAVTLFIGPEGGFSAEEVAEARKGGVISVSLGPRTLRTETAAIAASALIIYTLENL